MITLLVILSAIAGFILGALIFGKEQDGIMYFWTDEQDGKIYTQMRLKDPDIHTVAKKKSITLYCVQVPPLSVAGKSRHIVEQ